MSAPTPDTKTTRLQRMLANRREHKIRKATLEGNRTWFTEQQAARAHQRGW